MTNEEAIYQLKEINKEAHIYSDAVDMAIEALKAQSKHSQNTSSKQAVLETFGVKTGETCADVISRQDAIDAILADKIDAISLKVMTALGEGRLALTLNDACDRHIRDIEQLPSVQPEQRWIPCKWHRDNENLPEECKSVLICIVDGNKIFVDVSYRTDYNRWERYGRVDVIAWMPLPEPYKEESNGKNV